MFKFGHYKQSNGFQCQLSMTNYYGNDETPLMISKKYFRESHDVKKWALSNVQDFLTGTLDAYVIRLIFIKDHVFLENKGGDTMQRNKFMKNYWLVLDLKSKVNYYATPFAKAELIKTHFGVLMDSIPHDKELGFDVFLAMAKDIIKATNFIMKSNKTYNTKPLRNKTKENARRL